MSCKNVSCGKTMPSRRELDEIGLACGLNPADYRAARHMCAAIQKFFREGGKAAESVVMLPPKEELEDLGDRCKAEVDMLKSELEQVRELLRLCNEAKKVASTAPPPPPPPPVSSDMPPPPPPPPSKKATQVVAGMTGLLSEIAKGKKLRPTEGIESAAAARKLSIFDEMKKGVPLRSAKERTLRPKPKAAPSVLEQIRGFKKEEALAPMEERVLTPKQEEEERPLSWAEQVARHPRFLSRRGAIEGEDEEEEEEEGKWDGGGRYRRRRTRRTRRRSRSRSRSRSRRRRSRSRSKSRRQRRSRSRSRLRSRRSSHRRRRSKGRSRRRSRSRSRRRR